MVETHTLDEVAAMVGGEVAQGSFETHESEDNMAKTKKPARKLKAVKKTKKTKKTEDPVKVKLTMKLQQLQQSHQMATQKRQQHMAEADRLRSQIDAHVGAIQATKETIQELFPEEPEKPEVLKDEETPDGD